MPSFGDTALIALLALLLFGPKKLPELARQLGKLMGEFRRASNEFRMQMEDELRVSEQAENQKRIAAMEAAAPIAPVMTQETFPSYDAATENTLVAPTDAIADEAKPDRHSSEATTPLPIATSGDLSMMPPASGLPVSRTSASPLSSVLESIPHAADPETLADQAALHG